MKVKLQVLLIVTAILGLGGVALADLNDGLVGYYPFNGNANDESANANDGVVNGASLTNDRYNNSTSAYNFDGNDRITINDTSTYFNNSTAFSLSVWVKTETTSGYSSIVSQRLGSSNDWRTQFILSRSTSKISFRVYGFDAVGAQTWATIMSLDNSVSINTWHHIAATYGNNQIALYIDGVSVGTEQYNDPVRTVDGAYTLIGFNPTSQYFKGAIDDVRFYNRALTTSEIQQLAAGVTTSTSYNLNITKIQESTVFGGQVTISGQVTIGTQQPASPAKNVQIKAFADSLSKVCSANFSTTDSNGFFSKTYPTGSLTPGSFYLSLGVSGDTSNKKFLYNIPLSKNLNPAEVIGTASLKDINITIKGTDYQYLDTMTKTCTNAKECSGEISTFDSYGAVNNLADQFVESMITETVSDIVSNPGMWIAAPVAVVTCLAPEPSSKVFCAASIVYMKQAVTVSVVKGTAKAMIAQSSDEEFKNKWNNLVNKADVVYSIATLKPESGFMLAEVPDLWADGISASMSISKTRENSDGSLKGATIAGKTDDGKYIMITAVDVKAAKKISVAPITQLLLQDK